MLTDAIIPTEITRRVAPRLQALKRRQTWFDPLPEFSCRSLFRGSLSARFPLLEH